MRWPWVKRPPPPQILPYQPPIKPVEAKEPAIVVDEIDASKVDDQDLAALRLAQTQTGMHRVWKRLSGKLPGP